MANWTRNNATMPRVDGEVVNDGAGNQTPNGNPIGPEEKKPGFFVKAGNALASFGRRLWHAPTWAKVAFGSAVGLGAGYAIGKLTGTEQDEAEEFVPVRIDWTEDVPEIPEMPIETAEIADTAEEAAEATARLSSAVEQIIAPSLDEVTTE